MKKTALKALAVVMAILTLLGGTGIVSLAADSDIGNTVNDLQDALGGLNGSGFWQMISALLQSLGFQGSASGYSDMAGIMDWFLGLLHLDLYGNLLNSINTTQFVDFINGIFTVLFGAFAQ